MDCVPTFERIITAADGVTFTVAPYRRIAEQNRRPKGTRMPDNSDIPELTFEQALAELEKIVRDLEEGEAGLDGAIDSYARGALLKQHCQKKLDEAKERVDKITVSADGSVGLEAADLS